MSDEHAKKTPAESDSIGRTIALAELSLEFIRDNLSAKQRRRLNTDLQVIEQTLAILQGMYTPAELMHSRWVKMVDVKQS